MILRFERSLAAPPEAVWPLLTVPHEMNRWSEAKVSAVAPGAGGAHDGVGATRRVSVPAFGFTSTLDEEVVESERYTRFAYRVVRGGALRNHRGTQRLALVDGGGSALVWEVRFEAAVPGLERVLGAILRPRLSRSLDVLVAIVAGER